MTDLDLLIIGSGSGNSILTDEYEGWRVGIVERGTFGGTCLNVGCIPSKMLILPAGRVAEAAEAARLGVDLRLEGVDWPGIRDRVFGRIDPISAGGLRWRSEQPHVTVYEGDARCTGPHTVAVRMADGSVEELVSERIVLAAGARASVPPVPGLADVPFHTSDTIMRVDRVPEHLVVLGGGYIAAELGHVFAAMGSRVSVVHRGDRLIRHEDVDVSVRFTECFANSAFLHLNADVRSVAHADGEFVVEIEREDPGRDPVLEVVTGDALLVATGRVPNGGQLNVTALGVRLDPGGYVITDDTLRTDAEGVWAIGDIRNPKQLKHLANQEARVVSHNLLHPDEPRHIDQRVVPHAIFSHPEVGSVGEREVDLQARRHPYRVGRCDVAGVAYGWALEDTSGFAKVLVCEETGLLLGGHVIGPQAATLVQQLVQAMQFGITAERLAREQIWCHPALSEVLENALLDAVG
ncbi:MAG: mycothione reductase [Microthrixaceae bacterium]